jgi:hypothetical protein
MENENIVKQAIEMQAAWKNVRDAIVTLIEVYNKYEGSEIFYSLLDLDGRYAADIWDCAEISDLDIAIDNLQNIISSGE